MTPNDYYPFILLVPTFGDDEIDDVAKGLMRRYQNLANGWTPDLNSHWTARVFYSAKLILSATVTVNSLTYAEEHNLRVVLPYLRYYSVLSVLRAVTLMLPEITGDLGSLLKMTHSKAINMACSHISTFNSKFGKNLKERILLLKAQRELISYSAPTSADHYANSSEDIGHLCCLLAEIAQFDSEYLEDAVLKNSSEDTWVINDSDIDHIATIVNEGYTFNDIEDAYRLDYFARKNPRLTNILFSMTEGHTEDFFGAWRALEDESPGDFNSDLNTQVVFAVP